MPSPNRRTRADLTRPNGANCFMLEYINKPKETIQAWKNLWYHSGDIGYLDDDGYLHFVGRQAHWVRGGEKCFSIRSRKSSNESSIGKGLRDCWSSWRFKRRGHRAYIHLEDGEDLNPEEVVEWCEEHLAYFKVPRFIEFVTEFPRTITKQEIERHALRDEAVATHGTG